MKTKTVKPADAALLRKIADALPSSPQDGVYAYVADIDGQTAAARLRALADVLDSVRWGHVDTVMACESLVSRRLVPPELEAYHEACEILATLVGVPRVEAPAWMRDGG